VDEGNQDYVLQNQQRWMTLAELASKEQVPQATGLSAACEIAIFDWVGIVVWRGKHGVPYLDFVS
jgi:hypothetical protein